MDRQELKEFAALWDRLMDRFDRLEEKIDRMTKRKDFLDGDELMDTQERIILFKGFWPDRPNQLIRVELSAKENGKFEKGKIAKCKGGIFYVQK
jgi:hypothetical protein